MSINDADRYRWILSNLVKMGTVVGGNDGDKVYMAITLDKPTVEKLGIQAAIDKSIKRE